jgi:hypothetical protein
MYSLGTWFVSGIYVCINTLHKGDNDDDNNNNNRYKELKVCTIEKKALKKKGKVYPCTGTEAMYRQYGP